MQKRENQLRVGYLSLNLNLNNCIQTLEKETNFPLLYYTSAFYFVTFVNLARSRAATMTTLAPTYLGPRYPGGLFGTVDLGVDTAVRSSGEIFLNFGKYFLIARFFNEWVEQVKAEIPAERLLVFEVKQGWGPLCQFLGEL